MSNHLCNPPPAPKKELAGAIWRCAECGEVFRAIPVWADIDHVYVYCDWKRCGRFRRWLYRNHK